MVDLWQDTDTSGDHDLHKLNTILRYENEAKHRVVSQTQLERSSGNHVGSVESSSGRIHQLPSTSIRAPRRHRIHIGGREISRVSNVDLHLSTQMPHVQPEYKNSSSSVHETRIDFEQSDGRAAAGTAEDMNVCCSVGVPELAVSFDIIGLLVCYDVGERTGSALRITLPVTVSDDSVGEEGRASSVPSDFPSHYSLAIRQAWHHSLGK